MIVAIETPGGKRNLNININAQQANLHIKTIQVSLLHRNIIRAI